MIVREWGRRYQTHVLPMFMRQERGVKVSSYTTLVTTLANPVTNPTLDRVSLWQDGHNKCS